MDILGEEGERAAEAVENVSQRLEDLESHMDALDNAVQDVRRESRETDLDVVQENREKLLDMEELIFELIDVQKDSLKDIESERSRESRLESRIQSVNNSIRKVERRQSEIESRMDSLESKLFNVEEELSNEIGLNQSRIESKVSESTFENEKSEIEQQISRLKASMNALADDLDDDRIKVER